LWSKFSLVAFVIEATLMDDSVEKVFLKVLMTDMALNPPFIKWFQGIQYFILCINTSLTPLVIGMFFFNTIHKKKDRLKFDFRRI
jgi:hypothetical protein